jgi:hypothetical protein
MKIGIEINGVLRNTIEKFKQVYQKHLIDNYQDELVGQTFQIDLSGNTEENDLPTPFQYKILDEPTSLDLMTYFSFQNKEELYSFMYEEYTMELFGHAPSTEMNTFNVLNDLYYELRDEFELTIVSDEIGKSKPASLFFLAKFGCLLEKVIFYSEITKKNMWDSVDVLITANPELILNKPEDKTVIKFITNYNKNINCDFEISTLSDFKLLLKKIRKEYV